jgi:hypothetical protein
MPLRRSSARRFHTDLPTYAEWERLSGGSGGLNVPLLQYINKRMYELSIYTRYVQQFAKMESERLACLVQIWNATRMYEKANSGGPSTFGRGKRNPTSADARFRVSLGAGGSHDRGDAVDALRGLVAQELMTLMGAPSEAALKAMIKASVVCELTGDGRASDYTDGKLVATHLSRDERAQHRVIFERGVALMHARDPSISPLEWVPADTCDQQHSMESFRNSCYIELSKLLTDALDFEPFHVGNKDAAAYWRKVRPSYQFGTEGYVMTHGRKLYMSALHQGSEFYHSAYTSGAGVACSGSVTFVAGAPTLLTNASGHYKPTRDKLNRVISLFEMGGVPLDGLNIVVSEPRNLNYFYSSVADYRRSLRSG